MAKDNIYVDLDNKFIDSLENVAKTNYLITISNWKQVVPTTSRIDGSHVTTYKKCNEPFMLKVAMVVFRLKDDSGQEAHLNTRGLKNICKQNLGRTLRIAGNIDTDNQYCFIGNTIDVEIMERI